jgi:hypothetical protein
VLASVGKNFIKIEQELTGIMFSKIVVLYEIYSKKSLNRDLIKIIDYTFMLKLQCKTTFNSVFPGKKIIKIEQESTLE